MNGVVEGMIDGRNLEEKVVGAAAWTREYLGNGLQEVPGEDEALAYLRSAVTLGEKLGWVNGAVILQRYVSSYEAKRKCRIEKFQGVLPLD